MEFYTHEVVQGDSLQKIARLYNVPDWRDIAETNKLKYPYIDSVFMSDRYKDTDYVAKIGSRLIIPVSSDFPMNPDIENLAYGGNNGVSGGGTR